MVIKYSIQVNIISNFLKEQKINGLKNKVDLSILLQLTQ